ncbi:hypothetical protein CEXT_333951 [Caerostris extrusa]|uniref:Uncharacterized protein n=1 Tax=Caerostris extrusa TaxID=172846 RepID=A0AAV4XZU1_CAEEX|nr:hypothetical protein CEXT_333951 [Caerostris extrusa]
MLPVLLRIQIHHEFIAIQKKSEFSDIQCVNQPESHENADIWKQLKRRKAQFYREEGENAMVTSQHCSHSSLLCAANETKSLRQVSRRAATCLVLPPAPCFQACHALPCAWGQGHSDEASLAESLSVRRFYC